MGGSTALWQHIDKMATCGDANDTCSFTAQTNGTHGEKVYIWAHHNGKLDETKATEMVKIKACTIDNIVPDISFNEIKFEGTHPKLSFKKWKFADPEC